MESKMTLPPEVLKKRDDLAKKAEYEGFDTFRQGFDQGYLTVIRKVESLFDAIKHGDDEHQAGLKKAIEEHFK